MPQLGGTDREMGDLEGDSRKIWERLPKDMAFPGGQRVKTSPSNVGGVGAKSPEAWRPKD